jgi:hypothetical protein
MVDRFAPEHWSKIMAAVRGRDTVPEKRVRSLAHQLGYRFRLYRGGLGDEMGRLILTVAFGVFLTAGAEAPCVCRCVDGQMQPLCSSSIDLPPICPMTTCALTPPSIAPIQPAQLPPLGTSQCSQRQVLNPATRQYEWRSICN